jgi:hypothetical protein
MKNLTNKFLKVIGNLLILSLGFFIIYNLSTNFWYAFTSENTCSNQDNLFSYLLCAFVYTFLNTGISIYKIIGPILCLLGLVVGTTGIILSLKFIKDEMFKDTDDGNGFITNLIMGIVSAGILYLSYTYFMESWLYDLVAQYLVNV